MGFARAIVVLLVFACAAFAASSFVIALDGSGSMKTAVNGVRKFEEARNATICAFEAMGENDEGALFVFEGSNQIRLVRGFTSNKQSLISAVRSLDPDYGGTDLRHGITVSGDYVLANASNANKFVIILSDGGAASQALNRTSAEYWEKGVKIQVVGLHVNSTSTSGKALTGIAGNGGGAYYNTDGYGTACEAMQDSFQDAAGGGKWCPLLALLPLALAVGAAIKIR